MWTKAVLKMIFKKFIGPAVFQLGICMSVAWCFIHWATQTLKLIHAYKLSQDISISLFVICNIIKIIGNKVWRTSISTCSRLQFNKPVTNGKNRTAMRSFWVRLCKGERYFLKKRLIPITYLKYEEFFNI